MMVRSAPLPAATIARAKYPAETPPPTTTIFLATEELISALARAFRVGLVCRRRAGEEEVRTFGVTSIEKAQRDEETCGFRPTKWKPLSPSAVKRASEVVVLDAVATGRVRHASMGSCAAAGIRYRAALRASEGRLSRRGRGVGRAETRATARAFGGEAV
jgi:hypothetical protein